ncbi:MAG: 2-methylisocitrate lyase-like PEP mutase family enzyme [Candidatus Deianiraeaceae bacterium]|jgi:2-methylisocitrate lyase-like PEP mutase family enzyme
MKDKNLLNFKELHNQNEILLVGNVWGLQSAIAFEKQGYKAISTSSAAIANSLELEDGEHMSFEQLNNTVKSITQKVSIPLTVDIEGGCSRNIDEIINNIITLHKNGVVGVNLEDSIVTSDREILNANEFSEIITTIKRSLNEKNIDIFLNIRTDGYIMGLENPLESTLKRITQYEKAGADGIFVPCITDESDIKQVVKSISLPVNVMAIPNLPSFEILRSCGVKRISMGPFVYNYMNDTLNNILTKIKQDQTFNSLF